MAHINLPISGQEQPASPIDREKEIAELGDRFYTVARQNSVIGPVFERRVSNWDEHLSTMRNFWY